VSERSQAKSSHITWFHLYKILENANQATVTDPWVLVGGCDKVGRKNYKETRMMIMLLY
jgi:hypothetical protein